MRTTITAHRLREPFSDYTVLVRTNGIGAVDLSLWLNDAEARELGQALLLAATPATPTPTTEAAA